MKDKSEWAPTQAMWKRQHRKWALTQAFSGKNKLKRKYALIKVAWERRGSRKSDVRKKCPD